MAEHLLFLTGRLAHARLTRILEGMAAGFTWEVVDIGVKVAALMTEEIIRRRLPAPVHADRVLLPGRFRGDLAALAAHYGVPFARGPEDVGDLPAFFGAAARAPDLSRYDVTIFAEIVDASALDLAAILARARAHRADGADVIDLGALPDTPFPQLEAAITALHGEGFRVSLDSADAGLLRRAALAGADFLLSLTEETLGLADGTAAVPVLIPATPGDLPSLLRAIDRRAAQALPFLADPVLDPIHFGFAASLGRYLELRRARPAAEILMGIGNLTELTDADTTGVTATLMGIASELAIRAVLVVQVSPHCRRAVAEADRVRRMFFAAREAASLPVGLDSALLALHDRRPYAATAEEIAALAAMIGDANFRIETAADGIHIYNRALHAVATDPYALFPRLGVEADGAHAFYLGVETAKAEIAWRLGKRYAQDEPLGWGVAAPAPERDLSRHTLAGATLPTRRRKGGAG